MQPNNKEVIAGHVLATPTAGVIQQADGRKFSDVVTTSNNHAGQKGPLVARLDAKKTMAEISIPVSFNI